MIDKGEEVDDKFGPSGGKIWVSSPTDLDLAYSMDYLLYNEYIYSTPIDAATAKADGCGYISAINAEPVYAEVAEVE